MTYVRLAIASLLLVCSQLSFADSIKTYYITSVSMQMSPNDGSGDNIFFTFSGPNIEISGIGGMGCFDWSSTDPYPSIPSVGPSQVFLSGFLDPVVIGGVSYSSELLGFNGNGPFNDSGGVYPLVSAFIAGDPFIDLNLIFPTNGTWSASYSYVPPNGDIPGAYYFDGASFEAGAATPEPSNLALTLTGLAGIAGLVKRKYSRS